MPEIFYNQTNGNNYIYNDTKIEFINGAGLSRLIPQVSGAAVAIYVKLDENKGLVAIDSSGNGRHGAFQGGLDETAWQPGKINTCIQGDGSGFINFDNFGDYERTQDFSISCWFKYTSSTTQILVSKQSNTGNSEGYALNVTSEKIRFLLRDTAGNRIVIESPLTYNDGNWHLIQGTWKHIDDGSGGSLPTGIKLYVDNSNVGILTISETLTATIRNSSVNLQISGRDGIGNNPLLSSSYIDEVQIYERELSAAEIAFLWNNGNGTQELPGATTAFPTDNPTAPPAGTIKAIKINSFDADITIIGNNTVEFTWEVDGVEKYWNGSAWVDSTGYPETNDVTTMNTNSPALLDGTVLKDIRYVPYYHSDDGSETPELNTVSFDFTIAAAPEEKETCLITFDQSKITADPSIKQIIVVPVPRLVKYKDTIITREDIILLSFPENGFLQQEFLETENMTDPLGIIQEPYYSFIFGNVILNRKIPNLPAKNFWDLEEPC